MRDAQGRELHELAEINPTSLGAGTPPNFRFRYIDISSVSRGEIRWPETREMAYREAPSRARRLVEHGDVLFGTVRPALQSHGYIDVLSGPLVASTGFAVLRARPKVGNSRFILHALFHDSIVRQARQTEVGSNYPAVNESDLRRFVIHCPPVDVQARIAEILDTLDDAIRSTEQLIAKLENVKCGLLHDLLTRGIDDNGEIRDPERHPEQFKNSEIGRIPAAWEVARLGSLLIDGPRNGMYKPASEIGSGRLIVGQVAFDPRDRVDYSAARRARVTPSEHAVYGLRDGDLLVTRVFAVVTGVGRSILVDQPPEDAVYESNMMRLRVGSRVLPSWVFFAMKQPTARHHIESYANASNQTSINQVGLNSMPCPVAPIEEQRVAMDRVGALEALLIEEAAALTKLRLLKKGLADDLLTGCVPVTAVVETAP